MDTGRAGTIYGQSIEDLLGKSFFAKHGLLPRGYRKEGLHTFPSPDFQNLGAGSWAEDKAEGVYTASSSSRGNVGWNFGADKGKALLIVANVHAVLNRAVLFINDGQPNTNEAAGANALGFRADVTDGNYKIGSIASANGWNNGTSWSTLATADTPNYTPLVTFGQGMAVYVDTAGAGVLKAFLRLSMYQWTEIATIASNHLAVVRCATLLAAPSVASKQYFVGPVGIYAE